MPMPYAEPAAPLEFKTEPTEDAHGAHIQLGSNVTASYLYQRSSDEAKNEDAVAWRLDPRGLFAFAVCDGVSQSYYGSIAANFLAEALVRHLPELVTDLAVPPASTAELMRAQLDAWSEDGRQLTEQHQERLEQSGTYALVNPIVREQMEHRRQRHGSQAVFFCGCLDFRPGSGRKSLFAWMGNVQGQAFDCARKRLLDTARMVNDQNRWTTVHGCRGDLLTRWIATEQIDQVLVVSDGLVDVVQELTALSEAEEPRMLQTLRSHEFPDDASLLSVWLRRRTPRVEPPRPAWWRGAVLTAILCGFLLLVGLGLVVGKALRGSTALPAATIQPQRMARSMSQDAGGGQGPAITLKAIPGPAACAHAAHRHQGSEQ
jgi:serine/threonine protein phosphatase PrpC